jgi:hypothetical protein
LASGCACDSASPWLCCCWSGLHARAMRVLSSAAGTCRAERPSELCPTGVAAAGALPGRESAAAGALPGRESAAAGALPGRESAAAAALPGRESAAGILAGSDEAGNAATGEAPRAELDTAERSTLLRPELLKLETMAKVRSLLWWGAARPAAPLRLLGPVLLFSGLDRCAPLNAR